MHKIIHRLVNLLELTLFAALTTRFASAQTSVPTTPTVVKASGAQLEYAPLEVAKSKSSEKELMQIIARATATLVSEKSLGFRRDALPAGKYDLRVEKQGDKGYFLVIEAQAKPDAPGNQVPAPKESRKSPGAREKTLDEAPEAEENESEKLSPEPQNEGAEKAEAERESTGAGLKSANRPKKKAEKMEPRKESPRPRVTRLKVPLSIGACERKGDSVHFGIAERSKGIRLRLTVRAGEVEARATLRFGDEK